MTVPDPRPSAPVTKAGLDETIAKHEEHEELSLASVLSSIANRIFRREAISLLAVLVIGAAGALYGRAWAQSTLDGGVAKQLAPALAEVARLKQQTEAEQTAIKAEQTAIKAELTAVRIEVATTRAGVEMLLRAQGLTPPRSIHPDGGP